MKKKILALCLVVVLAITAVTGATLAYFTDTDSKTNTFTSGNVQIEQNEKDRNGEDFVDEQVLLPIVHDAKDKDGYHTGANYIDKIVTVTNTGNQPAYIRTHIAIPAALDNGPTEFDANLNILHWNAASAKYEANLAHDPMKNDWYWGTSTATDWPGAANAEETNKGWNFYQTTVDEVAYNVYVATHASAVAANATTGPNLIGLYLDKDVDCKVETDDGQEVVTYYDQNGNAIDFDLNETKVLVFSEAVQSEGFTETDDVAFAALNETFGTPGTDGYKSPWGTETK